MLAILSTNKEIAFESQHCLCFCQYTFYFISLTNEEEAKNKDCKILTQHLRATTTEKATTQKSYLLPFACF